MTDEKPVTQIPEELNEVYNYIDANQEKFIDDLKEAVSIQSVSSDLTKRKDLISMAHWMAEKLRFIGVTVELFDLGRQIFKGGSYLNLPPVVLGYFGNDPQKKTVLFCGHYDVLSANISDGWDSDPFNLLQKGEKLFGRGVSDNKGPCIIWKSAVEAYMNVFQHLPLNIKFFFDGMDECGSPCLDYVFNLKKSFFENVDYIVVSEESWLSPKSPCITYSLRGWACFCVEVECCKRDLHSGSHGGVIHEAMPDLIYMLEGLVGDHGEILIPGLYNDVAQYKLEEEKLYSKIDFNVQAYKKQCDQVFHTSKVNLLMSIWRYPSLTVHEIEGVHSEIGEKTVIPRKASGKFSVRTVPNQKTENVIQLITEYLDDKWKARNSINKYTLHTNTDIKDWIFIPHENNHNYDSAIKATKYVYGVEPQLVRSGLSSNYLSKLQGFCKASILLLPLSSADDNAHSQNENIEVRVYLNGIKLVASYLYELSKADPYEI